MCQFGKTLNRHCSIKNAYPAARFCVASEVNLAPKNRYNSQNLIINKYFFENIVKFGFELKNNLIKLLVRKLTEIA
jgi:hypothetical protein